MFGIDDAALATMLAGGISTAAGLYTNKKNRDYQAEANRINWEIAQQNNATQVEMANTAHEREVRDLRRAGLNPILSSGGSGASSPTLQAPGIESLRDQNAFDGLANSAKGLGRFLSQEYKNQVAGQILDNAGKELDNSNKELENTSIGLVNQSQVLQNEIDFVKNSAMTKALNAEFMKNQIEYAATALETGLSVHSDSDGLVSVSLDNPSKFDDAVKQAREGIRSDWSMRGNENLRAWLSTGLNAVNSAASAVRSFRKPK